MTAAETRTAPASEDQQTQGSAQRQQTHPLETPWCFWLRLKEGANQNSRDWQQQHVKGHVFNTVEGFWCLINNLHNPFETSHCDYSVFRNELTPDYDVEPFKGGGRIILQLGSGANRPGGPSMSNRYFDIWVHLLLALIGENFDDIGGQSIGGLRLVTKPRGGTKFEIWTTSTEQAAMEPLMHAVLNVISPLVEPRDKQQLKAKFAAFPGNDSIFDVELPK